MEKQVEDTKNQMNNQMDELEGRQAKLVNENNILCIDIDSLKLEIAQLKPQRETVQDKHTQKQNKTIDNDYDEDTREYRFNFTKTHPIDSRMNGHPILTPFQFLYPKENRHTREVESHKLHKTNLDVKCLAEDNIFIFYKTL